MSDLLDDHYRGSEKLPLSKDKEQIKFEGMVPYLLLNGDLVAVVCIALQEANIDYKVENKAPVPGRTHNSEVLEVLLHVREDDKAAIDRVVSSFEEQGKSTVTKETPFAVFLKWAGRLLLLLAVVKLLLYYST